MKFLALIVSVLIFSSQCNPIIILVHGTFAAGEDWCKPRGEFYKQLERQARKLRHNVIPFTWTGGLSDKDRIQAAESLAKVILSYPDTEKKIIIGHSHGGNVINITSQFLRAAYEPILKPLNNKKKDNLSLSEKIFNALFREKRSGPNKEDLALKILINKTISSISETKLYSTYPGDRRDYLIEAVYLLATPIDQKSYSPDMSIIKNLYNFYSIGDHVQQVLGIYSRLLHNLERTVNFRISIEKTGGIFDDDPSHSEIHNQIVAKWILDIPEALRLKKFNGFENFIPNKNGKIYFNSNGEPYYKIDKKSSEERENKERKRSEDILPKEVTKTLKRIPKMILEGLQFPPIPKKPFHFF